MNKLSKTNNYQNFLVTQSNDLIEGSYSSNLTTLSLKVLNLIIAHINPEENYTEEPVVTIDINMIKRYLGWTEGMIWNRFYKDLDEISIKLNSKPIATMWVEPQKYERVWFLAKYGVDTKRGEVSFTIRKELIPHLTKLKQNFTSYQLMNIPNLKSVYAIRIYSLLCQYLKIGSRKFDLTDFKLKVGAPDKYKYNDVKKRVILPAQKQLKEHTNIRFEFEEFKTGRSVTSLYFIIIKNTKPKESPQGQMEFLKEYFEETENDKAVFTDELFENLRKTGITKERTIKYLAQGFDIIEDEKQREEVINSGITLGDYYNEKFELLSQSSAQKNPAGFFIKALKQNWKNTDKAKEKIDKETAKSRGEAKRKLAVLEKSVDSLISQKRKADNKSCSSVFENTEVLERVYKEVIAEAKEGVVKGRMLSLRTLPIREQYEKQSSLQMYMDNKVKKEFPEKFEKSAVIQAKINQVKKQITMLKKENTGL